MFSIYVLLAYNPPGNVKYPFGDEMLNTNVLGKPVINEMKGNNPQKQFKKLQYPAVAGVEVREFLPQLLRNL